MSCNYPLYRLCSTVFTKKVFVSVETRHFSDEFIRKFWKQKNCRSFTVLTQETYWNFCVASIIHWIKPNTATAESKRPTIKGNTNHYQKICQKISFILKHSCIFLKNTYETPETDCLQNFSLWNKLTQGGDRVSEKINQVEQISLVRRHLVRENYSSGTSSTDRAKDLLWIVLCLDSVLSTQLSIETLRRTKLKNYTVTVDRRLKAL